MPIAIPAFPLGQLSPAEAARIASRGRKLLRAGRVTHRQLALLDCLLWSCRRPGTAAAIVSYTAMQRLARVSRGTIAAGLRALEGVGLIQRIKRRVRLSWHSGGTASRQATSVYVLHAPTLNTEFTVGTVNQAEEILYVQQPAARIAREAQVALEAVRTERGAALGLIAPRIPSRDGMR